MVKSKITDPNSYLNLGVSSIWRQESILAEKDLLDKSHRIATHLPSKILSTTGQIQLVQEEISKKEKEIEEALKEQARLQKMIDAEKILTAPRNFEKGLAEECVSAYLDACASAAVQARGEAIEIGSSLSKYVHDPAHDKDAIQRARVVWSLLQHARLFIIHPLNQYGRFYQAADRYTVEQLAGLDFDTPLEDINEEDSKKFFDMFKLHVPKVPFPNPLPFDSVFLAYGQKLTLSDTQILSRFLPDAVEAMGVRRVCLLGHVLGVIGEQPWAFTIVSLEGTYFQGPQIACVTTYDSDGWAQPACLDCWVLNSIIDAINEHKKIVVETPVTLGMKFDHKKKNKKARKDKIQLPLPKPYYTVTLKDEVIDETVRRMISHRVVQFSHRWDVRGHECIKIARGPLPMDPKLEAILRKREYRIYTINPMPAEDLERLLNRKIPAPRRDEWFAIKSFWKSNYIKGNPELPYIPAARKMS